MTDEDLISELRMGRPARPSIWAVAALVGACTFTAGALGLLLLGWR